MLTKSTDHNNLWHLICPVLFWTGDPAESVVPKSKEILAKHSIFFLSPITGVLLISLPKVGSISVHTVLIMYYRSMINPLQCLQLFIHSSRPTPTANKGCSQRSHSDTHTYVTDQINDIIRMSLLVLLVWS